MSESRLPTRACSMPAPSASLADVEQPLRLGRDLAHRQRHGAVGDEPVERDAEIERDQVALARAILVGDPVHDHRVRRDAERGREALVALGGRVAALRRDVLVGDAVELPHLDPGLEMLGDERERLGEERARTRHPLDLGLGLADDHGTAPRPCDAAASRRARPRSRGRPRRRCGRRGCRRRSPGASGSTRPAARSPGRRARGAARSPRACRRSAPPPPRGRAAAAGAPPDPAPGGRRRRRARARARGGARRAPPPGASCAGSRRGRSRRPCRRARAGRGSGGSSGRPIRGRRGRRPPSAPGRDRSAAPSSRGSCRPSRCAESRTSP